MFFTTVKTESRIKGAVDEYGDSFTRDVTVDELKEVRRFSATLRLFEKLSGHQVVNSMPTKSEHSFSSEGLKEELEEHGKNLGQLPGWMFEGLLLYIDRQLANDTALTDKNLDFRTKQVCDTARFAGAHLTNDLKDGITHVLFGQDRSTIRALRQRVSK